MAFRTISGGSVGGDGSICGGAVFGQRAGGIRGDGADDPFTWLEEIQGERALAWARHENERTLGELQADPRYQRFYDRALEILQARDRIPAVQHAAPTGSTISGRTPTMSAASSAAPRSPATAPTIPHWETVLDVDALAAAERQTGSIRACNCLPPEERRCLVFLSDGGRDANVVREFDARRAPLRRGRLRLPDGKQSVAWEDENTILVAREWGPGTMTASGYPFVIKRLRRGQTPRSGRGGLSRHAAGRAGRPVRAARQRRRVHGVGAYRGLDFFHNEFILFRAGRQRHPADPAAAPRRSGIVDGRLLVTLDEAWDAGAGPALSRTDSLVSYDLAEWKRDPLARAAEPGLGARRRARR